MRPSEELRIWARELAAMIIDARFRPERPYLPDVGITFPKAGCSVAAFEENMSPLQRARVADAALGPTEYVCR